MPRKTMIARGGALLIAVASMRPRPDAAENARGSSGTSGPNRLQ